MKIGTFYCWLWGHKFVATDRTREDDGFWTYTKHQLNYCTRCGIDRVTNPPQIIK